MMQATFLKYSAVLIVFSTLVCPAGAQSDEAGWYLGANVGRSSVDEDLDGATIDTDATSFRLYGGFDFNEYVAIEAQYIDFGSLEETVTVAGVTATLDADANGFGVAAVGRLPLGEQFSLSGKLGFLAWDADVDVSGIADNDNDQDVFFGLGAEYRFADTWTVVGEIEQYRLDNVDLFVWSVGARMRF